MSSADDRRMQPGRGPAPHEDKAERGEEERGAGGEGGDSAREEREAARRSREAREAEEDERVDEAGVESFPASDAPPWTLGEREPEER